MISFTSSKFGDVPSVCLENLETHYHQATTEVHFLPICTVIYVDYLEN